MKIKPMHRLRVLRKLSTGDKRRIYEIIAQCMRHEIAIITTGINTDDETNLYNIASWCLRMYELTCETEIKKLEHEEKIESHKEENDRKHLLR